ncbi:MAG: ABC transporter permease [Flavobacteriales bacterium]|nr:ABC transporter permease [Flavobacteriales bacterium]
MISFLLKKIGYGLLVLFGVVAVVFFLFNLAPGDPARNLAGENASEEVVTNLRRKMDLDLPVGKRFLLYLNDISPLAIHNPTYEDSRIYYDPKKYTGFRLFNVGSSRSLFLKMPYLKRSFVTDKNVSETLAEVLPGTAVLALLSIALAMVIGLMMGIIAALNKDTFYDRLMLFISALGMAGPSFFVAIIVAWIGAILWREQIAISVWLIPACLFPLLIALLPSSLTKKLSWSKKKWATISASLFVIIAVMVWMFAPESSWMRTVLLLPGTGLNMTGSLYSVDVWQGEYLDVKNMILPVITLMIRPLSVIVQLTRSSLLDVMQQDFIRTARAKGLPEFTVVYRHALRNALNPVITAVSGWLASLLAGAIFVEFVFGWKGLGQQMFTAIENQDMPVVMGGVIVIAAVFVLINLFVDIIYGWIDPRVRVSS